MIIYPAIDLRQGKAVRLRQGRAEEMTVFADDPLEAAQRWLQVGAEWLHIVNLDGAFGETSPNLEVVARIVAMTAQPVQFGGGLRDLPSIRHILGLGVRRVVLGTVALTDPAIVAGALQEYGPARIAVGLDARDGYVATHGWQDTSTVLALTLAKQMREMGVGIVVYTDISRDGMLEGVNVKATAQLAKESNLKVIASGGVASLADISALKEHEADGIEGVITGQAIYTGTLDLAKAIITGRS